MVNVPYKARDEESLMELLWSSRVSNDPVAFVLAVWPWGEVGTPLAGMSGPRSWQRKVLEMVRDHLAENSGILDPGVFRLAVSSGRGIGKSALVSWLIWWFLSTRIGSTVIVSANTENQLKSVTWGELGKWKTMALNSHWFEMNSMRLEPSVWLADAVKRDLKIDSRYWGAEAKLWKEESPDSYAGVHNSLGLAVFFDEASGIPAAIWDVAEGFFTEPTPNRFHFAFSNPRRNSGAFFECFHRNREYWRRLNIDSREVEGTDKGVYERIVRQYGEDSDQVRVEVKGEFPRQGDKQFISREVVELAAKRRVELDMGAPLLMGVDVARFGPDRSVIAWRQGRDARDCVPPWQSFKKLDTHQLTLRVAEAATKYGPAMIFVDGGGVGGPVVDHLRALRFRVIDVQFGAVASDQLAYANKRSEIWGLMKKWLETGAIPDLQELRDDFTSPEYDLDEATSALRLESKKRMASRGLASPDWADALANTFAMPVGRTDFSRGGGGVRVLMARDVDYPFFG